MPDRAPYYESPLCLVVGDVESVGAAGCDLVLREKRGVGFLALRGDVTDSGFTDGIVSVLGVAPPPVPTHYLESNEVRIFGIGPDEWLVALPEGEVARAEVELRHLTGHYAIADVSGGYTLVTLKGHAAENVLHKSGVYDFHRRNFPVGRSVQTIFAATNALIARTENESFDLVIRRSFVDHVARWIIDAGAEYGIRVEVPASTARDIS